MAAVLVTYGNVSAYLTGYVGLTLPGGMLVPNLAGVSLLLLWAICQAGLTADDLGLRRVGVFKSVASGTVTGALMALPALALFAFPPMMPAPITYRPMAISDPSQFLWKVGLELPIATALCEELAFRGVLQSLFLRSLAPLPAILATNTAFALWHLVVNYRTVFETNVTATGLVPLALIGGLAGVLAGGVIFSVLRQRTGALAGSVFAHWVVDALMMASMR
jgi:membrane protease YdiL (CAAX protease family)